MKFLITQRARHGDVFYVNLAIIRIVFFLGPEGTNAILKGTEKGGISFWAALKFVIGGSVDKGFPLSLRPWGKIHILPFFFPILVFGQLAFLYT